VANLSAPYIAEGFTLKNIVPLVDRKVYPEKQYPYGQWEYMGFYEENFAKAVSDFEADIAKVVKITFRAGSPEGRGQPCFTAFVRKQGGNVYYSISNPKIIRACNLISPDGTSAERPESTSKYLWP
jgi:hypothetical protein